MSPALLVATILTLGWNLVVLLVALFVTMRSDQQDPWRPMRRSREEMEAEIGCPELNGDAGLSNYNVGETAFKNVRSHLHNASQRVSVEAPYAEAPVNVITPEEGAEKRRCSICLN